MMTTVDMTEPGYRARLAAPDDLAGMVPRALALDVHETGYVLRELLGHAAAAARAGHRADLAEALVAVLADVDRRALARHRESLAERVQRWRDEWI